MGERHLSPRMPDREKELSEDSLSSGIEIDDPDGQQGGGKLADEQAPEVTLDPVPRDGIEHPGNPDQKAERVNEQGAACFSKSVDDTGKGAVGVEEGTDPGQCEDEFSGVRAAEQGDSDPGTEQQEDETAEQSQGKAGAGYFLNDIQHFMTVIGGLDLSHGGHQHDGNGTGDCRRK